MLPAHNPVLLIEDSPEDRMATMRAIKKAGLTNPVYSCTNGDEALDFLHQRGPYSDPLKAPRPAVILLDLNMPGTDGREVLNDIKKDESLKTIPVIVLTTSSDARDIEACYRSGANSYVTKPVDLPGFFETVQHLMHWWFKIVVLPK
jgi:CheY-like chemotaxis protein